MGHRNGRRTVTSALALLTVSLLALAGNQIAHAESTSSPYPSAVATPAPGLSAPGPSASSTGQGSSPTITVPSPRTSPEQAGRASDEGASAEPSGSASGEGASATVPAGARTPGAASDGEQATGRQPVDGKPVDGKPTGRTPAGTAAQGTVAAGPGATAAGATTAADRYGWGKPLPGSDEFNYTGPPDPAKWNAAGECWAGHAGNGKRCASRSTVDGSKLVQTGLANGDSAWIASKTDQRYGRWEARVRSVGKGPANGRQYHPLLIVWPSSNQWPQDGEYDFLENGAPGQQCAESFIHYPHAPGAVQQEFSKEKDCGAPLTEWHNVAFEWTPQYVRGYIDGKKWFEFSGGAGGSRRDIQAMPSGHLTIQLDNFFGGSMQPATYEVDWVRIYGLR